MHTPKLFKKYFLSTVVVVLAVVVLIAVILSLTIRSYFISERQNVMYEYCHSISVVSYNSSFPESNELSDTIHSLSGSNDCYILVVDSAGHPIACGCDDWYTIGSCKHVEHYVSKRIMQVSLNGKFESDDAFSDYYEEDCFTCGLPIAKQGGTTFASVFVSTPYKTIEDIVHKVLSIFFISILVPIAILIGAEFIISYRFAKPLKMMSDAAKAMAKGDFSNRIPIRSNDEVGELAQSFNEMTDAIIQNEATRKSFVQNVSHELRTPMTSIGGFIDGILDGTVPKKDTKKYLQITSDEIKRLARLVQSMFDIAKLDAGEKKLQPVEFNAFQSVLDILFSKENVIESKKLEIKGLSDIGEIIVKADKDLIHEVLYNLIDNAVKFNVSGGFIDISLKRIGKDLEFIIKNSGEIIKTEDLPFVFERFYKADKARSGVKDSTGLGLYIVKTIIDMHGGTVYVNSYKNEYTEFGFTLKNVVVK